MAEMREEFEARWPDWFDKRNEDGKRVSLVFGFQCNSGWRDLLWRLCEDIEKLGPGRNFHVLQVKEKFGGLRFYTSGTTEEVLHRIHLAEQESYQTCEDCGTKENVSTSGGWLLTLCEECRKSH